MAFKRLATFNASRSIWTLKHIFRTSGLPFGEFVPLKALERKLCVSYPGRKEANQYGMDRAHAGSQHHLKPMYRLPSLPGGRGVRRESNLLRHYGGVSGGLPLLGRISPQEPRIHLPPTGLWGFHDAHDPPP